MFRNQYDTDVTTFSPAGRLHQVEYAMEAVKQGSACVGLRSKQHAMIAAFKRSPSELASHQQKLFKIDDHMGIAIAGLIADARTLSRYMRNECLNHRFVFETPMNTGRLVAQVADKSQLYTQASEARPYGVGLLVAGFDKTGPHIYQALPSGVYYEYKAQAMGARSQSCKTYLEKHFETFDGCDLDGLVMHALESLKGSAGTKLTADNVVVGYCGKDTGFVTLEGDAIRKYVDELVQDDVMEEKEDAFTSVAL